MLKEVFNSYSVECQYPIVMENRQEYNYLVDFVIEELNLAIEYDEKHHKFIQNKDSQRQQYIETKTGFQFVRVSDEHFMREGKSYLIQLLKENKIAFE